MRVVRIEKEAWKSMSEEAHKTCFNEQRPSNQDRVDFAILVTSDAGHPLGYTTCKDHDGDSVYLQFGGAFPGTKGSTVSFMAFIHGVDHLKETYKNISFYVKNDNFVMLKFAIRAGFKVVGIKNVNGEILLECLNAVE